MPDAKLAQQTAPKSPATPPPMWELEDGDELIDTARVPNGARLRLVRNGEDFVILLDRNELMSTDVCASEVALAVLTCDRLGARPAPQLLIGGYGLGFTLRAALAALDSTASVTIAEIVPEIVAWARGAMHRLTAGCLDDPRVQLVHDDVAMLIDAARGGYDAILLDVDNGPEGLTRSVNNWLYCENGLKAASRALRPGGILAVWSAFKDETFVALLEKTGFAVEVVHVEAGEAPRPGKDPLQHMIFFATKA